ncbi:hypothetical protein ACS8E9_18975, partial [Pseudomonas neustonica]|uniref:hypothetical protein n=1 Tax=Pseudomonas neustonica TaxID=2487346 RepID=UPI003F4463FB
APTEVGHGGLTLLLSSANNGGITEEPKKKRLKLRINHKGPNQLIVLSNVTIDSELWASVPGELLKAYNDKNIYLRQSMTTQQEQEYVRYQPCSTCGAPWSVKCCQ